jgi:hypothetical protein
VSIRTFLLVSLTIPILTGSAMSQTTIPSVLSEHTAFVFLVKDVSRLKEHIGESPLAGLWTEAPVDEAAYSKFLLLRIQNQSGLSVPAIFDHFDDEAALVVPDLRLLTGSAEGDEAWAVLAVTPNEAPWQKLAKDLQAGKKSLGSAKSVKIRGQKAQVFVSGKKDSTLAWSWWQGMGALASSPRMLSGIMESRQGSHHLDQAEYWQKLQSRAPQGDIIFYADLEMVDAWLRDRMSGGQADSLGSMVGITPRSMVSALGLGAFKAASMTATLGADEAQLDGGILMTDQPGLARLMAYQAGPVMRPDIIPPDAVFASVSRFSLSDFWTGLTEMLDRIGPGMSYFARGQMQKIGGTAGLDFEKDILGNFGDETFLAYLPRHDDHPDSLAGMFDQLSGVAVKDPAKALKTVTALVEWAPTGVPDETTQAKPKKTETRVVNGVKVSTVHFGSGEKGSTLSYAVTDSMLLVAMGEDDILARALQNRGRGVSLWTRNDIAPLLASFPREACSLSYWDPSMLREKVKTARMDDERRQVALMLLQQVGPSVGYTLKTPDGYFSHVQLRRAFP